MVECLDFVPTNNIQKAFLHAVPRSKKGRKAPVCKHFTNNCPGDVCLCPFIGQSESCDQDYTQCGGILPKDIDAGRYKQTLTTVYHRHSLSLLSPPALHNLLPEQAKGRSQVQRTTVKIELNNVLFSVYLFHDCLAFLSSSIYFQ